MATAMLTILGLYQYDNTIFDGMDVPVNVTKQNVINNILMECAELTVIYPDSDAMKDAIEYWSNAESHIWQQLQDTTEYQYNPIWNKDGTYSETETRDLKGTGDVTTTGKVSAYNVNTFQNAEQSIVDADTTDTGTIKKVRRESGNIGVTTTQQMIKEQREVVEFNIITYITESFKHRFCIMVY